jgi:hypothetical protein
MPGQATGQARAADSDDCAATKAGPARRTTCLLEVDHICVRGYRFYGVHIWFSGPSVSPGEPRLGPESRAVESRRTPGLGPQQSHGHPHGLHNWQLNSSGWRRFKELESDKHFTWINVAKPLWTTGTGPLYSHDTRLTISNDAGSNCSTQNCIGRWLQTTSLFALSICQTDCHSIACWASKSVRLFSADPPCVLDPPALRPSTDSPAVGRWQSGEHHRSWANLTARRLRCRIARCSGPPWSPRVRPISFLPLHLNQTSLTLHTASQIGLRLQVHGRCARAVLPRRPRGPSRQRAHPHRHGGAARRPRRRARAGGMRARGPEPPPARAPIAHLRMRRGSRGISLPRHHLLAMLPSRCCRPGARKAPGLAACRAPRPRPRAPRRSAPPTQAEQARPKRACAGRSARAAQRRAESPGPNAGRSGPG